MKILREITAMMPRGAGDVRYIGGLTGASLSLALREIIELHAGVVLVMVPDFASAQRLEQECHFLGIKSLSLPDWETLPYDSFSPHQDIISQRITTLYRLHTFGQGVVIVPITTLMHRLCPREYVLGNTFLMQIGDKLDLPGLRSKLESFGYANTGQVMEHGEFAIRGSILDIFPMGAHAPYRIDLFDDEIESISEFDVDTQRSATHVQQIRLLPAREYPFTEEAITGFRTRWRDNFTGDPRACSIYQDVSQGIKAAGLEYYLPLFFAKLENIFDYLPDNTLIIQVDKIDNAGTEFWQQILQRYEQYRHDLTRPLLPPTDVFLRIDEIFALAKQYPQIRCSAEQVVEAAGRYNVLAQSLPDLSAQAKHAMPLYKLQEFIADNKLSILFTVESSGRKVVLEEMLLQHNLRPYICHTWHEYMQQMPQLGLLVAPFEQGVMLDANHLAIITEAELLGKPVMQQRRRRRKMADMASASIHNLAELNLGAPIVHIEHGVGRYQGLTTLKHGDIEGEYVTIAYANQDKLYVPVSALHMISRYSGIDLEHAPLHSLGTDKWQREKRKATQQIRDTAAELLAVYARRAAQHRAAYVVPELEYHQFAQAFPFEETVDQHTAIEQVIKDLTGTVPMDRVVCGDVGFGKTEVAMRAAFLVASAGRQVAVLVPTTLLAQQHYQTFVDRFADFPIHVEVISRFKTKAEQQAIERKINAGKCDIVIGTHKLLQTDVQFQNLGLLIIDEEHRFGVRQKEKFKQFKAQVDILTLTATPIPRTLNMAMSGIRDLSIISTPPAKRLSVKTFVREYSKNLIAEAVNRELSRGGQVYYLHNEVETIAKVAVDLTELLPTARIAIAHGQMSERELEKIMGDYYHRRYNILVCTTIIETGIDIPTANTIIINRADKLGLAQLHQLRGRVGRSHHQAYAFCLTPPPSAMTSDAVKRLQALESLDTLGAGFVLATHDLEIRGTGELLGEEQSGNLQTVGFSLYMELLEQCVKSLQQGQEPSLSLEPDLATEVDLQVPAFIPNDYLRDVHNRLVLYKRIASAVDQAELSELKVEMIDRFGPLTTQIENLFAVTNLKLLATKLGIKSIKAGAKGGKIEFKTQPQVDPDKIIALIKAYPRVLAFASSTSIRFIMELPEPIARIEYVLGLLDRLL